MIGNDVVDLEDPESRTDSLHPRFDERVFTAAERRRIAAADCALTARWMLWASKESAYKLFKQLDHRTIFSPQAFSVDFDEDGRTVVRHRDATVRVILQRWESTVHAVAALSWSDFPHAVVGLSETTYPSSSAVRSLARTHLARHLQRAVDEIAIVTRKDRVPMVSIAEQSPCGTLSLSHHGRMVAFAWLPDQPAGSNPSFEPQQRW